VGYFCQRNLVFCVRNHTRRTVYADRGRVPRRMCKLDCCCIVPCMLSISRHRSITQVNAPMLQLNDDFYEDLEPHTVIKVCFDCFLM
jgi:hypothetical protein